MNSYISKSLDFTFNFAYKLARYLHTNKLACNLALDGDLGAGKTSFTKGFVSYFNPDILVNSPTYTIINDYSNASFNIYHCDLYRINNEEDLFGSGFYELMEDRDNIIIVEWANRLRVFDSFVKIEFKLIDDSTREIIILNRSIDLCI